MNATTAPAALAPLDILGIRVRVDAHGRFNLNDLHLAAMAAAGRTGDQNKDHQRPGKFLRNTAVQAFISTLTAQNSDAQNWAPVSSVRGGKQGEQGTYADEMVVLRYAGWISPEFEIKAYRALKAQHDQQRGIPMSLYQQAIKVHGDESASKALASQAGRIMRQRRDEKPRLAQQVALMERAMQLCLALGLDTLPEIDA